MESCRQSPLQGEAVQWPQRMLAGQDMPKRRTCGHRGPNCDRPVELQGQGRAGRPHVLLLVSPVLITGLLVWIPCSPLQRSTPPQPARGRPARVQPTYTEKGQASPHSSWREILQVCRQRHRASPDGRAKKKVLRKRFHILFLKQVSRRLIL